MPLYNLTMIAGNTTGIVPIMQKVNEELMFGWYGMGMLIVIGIILFMAFMFSTNEPKKAILGTSFSVFVLSILFRALDLVGDLTPFIALSIVALSVAFAYSSK